MAIINNTPHIPECDRCHRLNVRIIIITDKLNTKEENICEKCWDKSDGENYGYYFDRNGCKNADYYKM